MKNKITPLVLLILIGCSEPVENAETDVTKTEYEYSITENKQITWNEVLSKSKSRYVVYFYSEYCGYCKQVKQEVLSYYLKNVDEMYFIDTVKEKAVYKSNDGVLIGTKNITDFYIFGTPFLARLLNHKISNYYVGVKEIRDFINMF